MTCIEQDGYRKTVVNTLLDGIMIVNTRDTDALVIICRDGGKAIHAAAGPINSCSPGAHAPRQYTP
jgi:hypothetical protein